MFLVNLDVQLINIFTIHFLQYSHDGGSECIQASRLEVGRYSNKVYFCRSDEISIRGGVMGVDQFWEEHYGNVVDGQNDIK